MGKKHFIAKNRCVGNQFFAILMLKKADRLKFASTKIGRGHKLLSKTLKRLEQQEKSKDFDYLCALSAQKLAKMTIFRSSDA